MKLKGLLLAFFACFSASAQTIVLPDPAFKNALVNTPCNIDTAADIDTNNDGEIQVAEAAVVTRLNIENQNISSIVGISTFEALVVLIAHDNQIDAADLSNLANLDSADLDRNALTQLQVHPNLGILKCSGNQLANLPVTSFAQLEQLYCNDNFLTTLDLSGCGMLQGVFCSNNLLTSIDLPSSGESIECNFNQLSQLDASQLSNLYALKCSHNNLASLSLPGSNLQTLDCGYNQLTTLDLAPYVLGILDVSYNQISFLDIANSYFIDLNISGNLYTSLQISTDGFFGSIVRCNDSQMTTLNLSQSEDLVLLEVINNANLGYLVVKNNDVDTANHLSIQNNPLLERVCADAGEIEILQDYFNNPNMVITSDCELLQKIEFWADNIKLYPNPAAGQIHLESATTIESLIICNVLGQIIVASEKPSGSRELEINIAGLPAGSYWVQIVSDGKKTSKKFIKL